VVHARLQKENSVTNLLDLVQLPNDQQALRGLLYTPREIAQQPETWQKTFELFEREQKRLCSFLEGAGVRDPEGERPTVFLIGAGTSDYIGHALELLLRQQWGCEVVVCASTDLLPNLDTYIIPGVKYLWISFSRSGDSTEGVAVLEQAAERFPQVAHLVVTCNPRARMIEVCSALAHASVVVLDDAVNDRSLAMTSSFTNMIVMGQCLAHAWSPDGYRESLNDMRAAGEALLVSGFALAEKLAAMRLPRLCLVGTGPLAAVAKESALKVLEMSAGEVKTMAESTLGLRHGPMAALDLETAFICFASSDARRLGYTADLLREVGGKAITAIRVAIGPRSAEDALRPLCDIYLALDSTAADEYRPVLDVLVGQMLGLCTSIEFGLKPDAPSPGGVISRVVQEFAVYR
jgi:tagatose-6-phosphate ketose/aldose isomerase